MESSVGIFIITFNRAPKLERTLAQLATSPFADCNITVLDNHSSDTTPTVCTLFVGSLPRLRIIRHRVNLGLSANYLRAVELADKPYTWVLGDDDELDTAKIDDVLEELRHGRHDLLVVGAVQQPEWALGTASTAQTLLSRGFPYFYITGWITGLVFRTDLFRSESFQLGYKNADNVFPHYHFFLKCLENDASVYLARRWIAGAREPEGYGRLGSEMLAGWMHSARYISDPPTRRMAIFQGPVGQGRPISYWRAAVLFFKAFGIHNVARRGTIMDAWAKCFVVSTWDVRLALMPSFLHVLCPAPVARAAWRSLRWMAGRSDRQVEEYTTVLDEART